MIRFGVCLFALFVGGKNTDNGIAIHDVYKDTIIVLPASSKQPTTLELSVTGNIDDTCILNNVKLNKGVIDTTLRSDWYLDSIILNYKAYKAKQGELIISYETF